MNTKTFHSYIAPCGKRIYEKYGHLIESLLPRRIYTTGLELPEGVSDDDGHVYHHGLMVMAPEDITPELSALFPEMPLERWSHSEQVAPPLPSVPMDPPRHPFAVRI